MSTARYQPLINMVDEIEHDDEIIGEVTSDMPSTAVAGGTSLMNQTLLVAKVPPRCKYFVIFNFILLFVGFCDVACGGIVHALFISDRVSETAVHLASYGIIRNEFNLICPYMLLAAGIASIFVALYGFCARYHMGPAITYCLLLGSTMFFHWVTAIGAYDAANSLSHVTPGLYALQNLTTGNKSDEIAYKPTQFFIDLQQDWQCCGVKDYNEWLLKVSWFRKKYEDFETGPGVTVVLTGCCSNCANCQSDSSQCKRLHEVGVYKKGCADVVSNYFNFYFKLICGMAAFFGSIQIFGLVIAVNLATSFFDRARF